MASLLILLEKVYNYLGIFYVVTFSWIYLMPELRYLFICYLLLHILHCDVTVLFNLKLVVLSHIAE